MGKILLAFVLCLITASAVYAEDKDSYQLDTIVVTPSRYEDSPFNVSKDITIIDSQDIDASQARTVPELLSYATSASVRDYLGNGKGANVDMRGFGETANQNVLVLMNGRRTNQIDLSGPDWTQIDVGAIERIEVVNGPQSVLYGDNATGGVINIVTKKGGGKPSIGVEMAAGSYDYKSIKTYISGGNPFLDYFGSYGASYTDGYRVNNDLNTSDYNFRLTVKPTDVVHINVSGGYHNDWYGMPGALTSQQISQIGLQGSAHPDDRAKTEDKFINFGPELRWENNGNILTFITDFIFRDRRTNTYTYYYPTMDPWYNENQIITRAISPRITYDTHIADHELKFLGGLDYYYNRDSVSSGDPTLVFSPLGNDLMLIEKETLGMYGTVSAEIFKNLYANIGARGEWTNYNFDQQMPTSYQSTAERPMKNYAWESGLAYRYSEHSSVYANASRSYRLPAVDEWYNAGWYGYWPSPAPILNLGLKPQLQMNYEVGVKDRTFKFLSLEGSVYFMDINHEIYYNPLTGYNDTYDHTQRNGFTAEAHLYPDKLGVGVKDLTTDLFSRYTLTNARFVRGTDAGNEVPGVSKNMVTAGVNITYMNSVTFGYLMHYIGPSYLISDQLNINSLLKGHSTSDIKLSYHKYGFEIYGAINNIFDERYSQYGVMGSYVTPGKEGTTENFYPAPGRNLLGGVKYAF